MKKTGLRILLLLLICALIGTTAIAANLPVQPEPLGTIKFMYTTDGSGVPLYSEESATSDVLGLYNSGIQMKFMGRNEEWYHVVVGVEPGIIEGYLHASYLSEEWTESAEQIKFWEVSSEGENPILALEGPYDSADAIGKYYAGTILEKLGECDQYYHVQMGTSNEHGTTSFIHKNHLIPSNRAFAHLTGAEAIGFAEVNNNLKDDDPLAISLQAFPDYTSKYSVAKNMITNTPGDLFEIIAITGEWCQVRSATDTYQSFFPCKCLDIYLYTDLQSSESPSDTKLDNNILDKDGTYLVGIDIPGGFANMYAIKKKDTGKPSWYAKSTLGGYRTDGDIHSSVVNEDTMFLYNGTLLYIENCIFELLD